MAIIFNLYELWELSSRLTFTLTETVRFNVMSGNGYKCLIFVKWRTLKIVSSSPLPSNAPVSRIELCLYDNAFFTVYRISKATLSELEGKYTIYFLVHAHALKMTILKMLVGKWHATLENKHVHSEHYTCSGTHLKIRSEALLL